MTQGLLARGAVTHSTVFAIAPNQQHAAEQSKQVLLGNMFNDTTSCCIVEQMYNSVRLINGPGRGGAGTR